MKLFNKSCKETILSLWLNDSLNEIEKEAMNMVKNIIDEDRMTDCVIRNFKCSADYMIEEINWKISLAKRSNLNICFVDAVDDFIKRYNGDFDELCQWYSPSNYNWNEKRWFTDDEIKQREQEMCDVVDDILKKSS